MPKPDVLLPILRPPLASLLFFTLVEIVCRSLVELLQPPHFHRERRPNTCVLSISSTRNSPALHTARVHHGQPEAVATRLECRLSDFQAQPLLQFITEATEAQILESGKSSGAHATPLCGRLPFDTPRAFPGSCEAPCNEQLPWPSGSYPP